jgi:EmrB/QacA subfamily drug resistance transporter
MVILDLSIVNVALPSIQTALDFSTTQLQWVVDAYAIVFAGFLMLGGRAADHFGQRRTFVVSLALFAATSLVGGMSVSSEMLIAARALQGLSGALMAATSLAIITASFPAGPARHRAIGLWSAMNGAGGAAGTLLGGVLTQELSWRWILLINPPIGLVAAFIAYRVVTERKRGEDAPRFDLAGALTMTLGTLVLVYGIVDTGVDGWSSPKALVPMGLGLVLLALFGVVETRLAAAPLVPFRELTGPMKLANAIVLLFSASLFPMWYVSSLYLQQVLGLSPLATGVAFLPMTLVIMLVASRAGKLVGRFGVRTVMGSGLVLMSAGMLLFARIGPSGSAWGYIVLPGVLTTAGIALSIVPSTIFATQGAGAAQAGLASGLVNTSRQAGGGLGLAVLITLATQYTSRAVGKGTAVTVALTEGFRLAFLIGAGLVIAAAIVTFAFVQPATARSGAPAGARSDGPAGGVLRLHPQWRFGMFIVAVLALFGALDFGVAGSKGPALGAYTTKGAYDFVSAPGLHPPRIVADVATKTSQLAPGYIMVGNFYDLTTRPMIGQSGPLILNNDLQPVWFRPVPENVVASDLATQTYHGEPVLTWWQGTITDTGQTQSGEDVIVNQHYHTVATLKGKDGWVPTMHEFLIRGNDAWVTADKNIPMNLAKYGGTSEGVLDDSAVQEYDLKTGQLLYTWDALDHLPLTDSHAQPPANGFPWDAYHVNSLQLVGQDKFLVSMRNTWAAYLVNMKTGRVEWQLGGKHSTFQVGKAASFEWQHDVRLHTGGVVTMFNDNCCQISGAGFYIAPAGPSAGLELRLHMKDRTVSVLAKYQHPNKVSAAYMGDLQLLPNGNVFIGWGEQPYLSEYSKSGQLLLDGVFPGPDLSYRATLRQWVGLPSYPPSGAARSMPGGTAVYASWNGATQVAAWRVLAGRTGSHLAPVAGAPKAGFETKLNVKGGGYHQVFEVEALNSKGKVIGSSKHFQAPPANH